MSSTLIHMIFLQENGEYVRRESLWTEGSAVAGRPPCSSASLTPSLITPPPTYPFAPLASLFALEHVEQASLSGS